MRNPIWRPPRSCVIKTAVTIQYEHLYVHLPFCDVICHYCDFYTARNKDADHAKLFHALDLHLEQSLSQLAPQLRSIYFGGGTPSASPPDLIAKFLERLRTKINANTEISLEANPNDLSDEKIAAWRAAGINRLSVGVQSLRPELLKRLSRTHSETQALDGIQRASRVFPIVSADLIYAVPGQEIAEPAEDAIRLLAAGASHLSAYHLTLEPEHFLHRKLPDEGTAWEQISLLRDKILVEKNFDQYEVSNFAPLGNESVHNRCYWLGKPYLALGPSGHSFDGQSRRWQNIPDWQKYYARLEQHISPVEFQEQLSPEQLYLEQLFTRLRTREGLPLAELDARFSIRFLERHHSTVQSLINEGLAELAFGHLKLSFRGRMLADSIVAKLSSLH